MKEESLILLRTMLIDYLSKVDDECIPKKDVIEVMEDVYYMLDPSTYKENKKKLNLKNKK